MNLNLNPMQKDKESDLDTLLKDTEKMKNDTNKNDTLNKILTYWFGIKQKEYDANYLKAHKEEWTNFLKKCFLKAEFYKSEKKVTENKETKKH